MLKIFQKGNAETAIRVFQDEKTRSQLIQAQDMFPCPVCRALYHPLAITMEPKPTSAASEVKTITLHQIRAIVRFTDGWSDPCTIVSKRQFLLRYIVPTMKAGEQSTAIAADLLSVITGPPPPTLIAIDCLSCPCKNSACPGFMLISDAVRAKILSVKGEPGERVKAATLSRSMLSWTQFDALSKAALAGGLAELHKAS